MKFKTYVEGDIKGPVVVSKKIDGVNVTFENGVALSRANNKLYNFDDIFKNNPDISGTYEVFRKDWNTTISLVKTQSIGADKVTLDDLYSLEPILDSRLALPSPDSPTQADISKWMYQVTTAGYEGLVIHQLDTDIRWKVKPNNTIDVKVLGVIPGKGRNTGRLGAVTTRYGDVGSGFKDTFRVDFFNDPTFIGSIIEVSYTTMTSANKMRHARFIRLRSDKTEETIL
jgi:hypothetical protein